MRLSEVKGMDATGRLLFRLLSLPSPPGGEEAASRFCARFLARRGFRVEVDRLGNVAAKRGRGPYIVLVSHLDDWGDPERRRFRVLPGGRVVSAAGAPLGGDDKCGVAIALALACRDGMPMAVLLTVREEVGGEGCRAFLERRREWFADAGACLVLDRRGEGDVVTRISGLELDPAGEFTRRVLAAAGRAGIQARAVEGLFSDAFVLAAATGLPAVNISVGYHEPHSPVEWVSLPEMRRAARWVREVLEAPA
ncbi:MAG: hypothetical protein ACPLRW_12910 [Moorellales bacterium]